MIVFFAKNKKICYNMPQTKKLVFKGAIMDKYISSIDKLNLGKIINSGSCSDIHQFIPNFYFKKFKSDYQDIKDPLNAELLEVLRYLSELKNMPYIVRAKDIYLSPTTLFGYSMPKIEAKSLDDIEDNILVSDLLTSFSLLSQDVYTLSKHYVKTEDIGTNNLLYNGLMYMIDLDLSLVDKRYIPDELYERTMYSLIYSLNKVLLDDYRYSDKINVNDWENYYKYLRELSSTELNQEAETIFEMKRGYQKYKHR